MSKYPELKKVSKLIANAILSRTMISEEEAAIIIEFEVKSSMPSILDDYSSEYEKKYSELLEKQRKLRPGSFDYNQNAYDITAIKTKIKLANTAASEHRKGNGLKAFQEYVSSLYGQQVIEDWYASKHGGIQVGKAPIFSTSKIKSK